MLFPVSVMVFCVKVNYTESCALTQSLLRSRLQKAAFPFERDCDSQESQSRSNRNAAFENAISKEIKEIKDSAILPTYVVNIF